MRTWNEEFLLTFVVLTDERELCETMDVFVWRAFSVLARTPPPPPPLCVLTDDEELELELGVAITMPVFTAVAAALPKASW